MNNSKLIHYLNSGVKCKTIYKTKDGDTNEIIEVPLIKELLGFRGEMPILSGMFSVDNFTPFLYPLSCLTETIIHEGKEEIPLVELAKIEGCYTNEDYEILVDEKGKWVCLEFEDGGVLNHFCYYPKFYSFSLSHEWNDWHEQIVKNQLLLFDYLYSRRINIWGIDAIDPNELGDNNPYLVKI
jgi:hypothetical protein